MPLRARVPFVPLVKRTHRDATGAESARLFCAAAYALALRGLQGVGGLDLICDSYCDPLWKGTRYETNVVRPSMIGYDRRRAELRATDTRGTWTLRVMRDSRISITPRCNTLTAIRQQTTSNNLACYAITLATASGSLMYGQAMVVCNGNIKPLYA